MLIRFKKNDGTEYPQWEEKRLDEIVTFKKGKGLSWDSIVHHGKNKCILYGNLYTEYGAVINKVIFTTNEKISECIISKKGDVLIPASDTTPTGLARASCIMLDDVILGGDINILTPNNIDGIYLSYCINGNKKELIKIIQGSTVRHLKNEDIACLKFRISKSKEEQQKIADFLSTVDQKIESQKVIVADYEELKKGTMQKIFNQEIRFKDDDGNEFPEWETLTLKDVFKEVSNKNHPELPVLSVAQGIGTVLRDESERRIMYDKSKLAGYKVVSKNDFIVHLRTFEGGLECSNHNGITSPAYRILRTDLLIADAFKYYFRSKQFIEQKLAIAVTGIRDGKNIDMPSFYEIQINVPCIEEQKKIADCLSALDRKIETEKKILADLEELKKGLLQAIFNN